MAELPNIVFFLVDDLGWHDLGVEGSTFYQSPNIDRIANEGMRFTNGYAPCQVCSPSRASILTGKYTPRHGITDWIGAASGEAWRAAGRHSKVLPPAYEHGLRKEEITFAEALRKRGYRTFFAGKWHLGEGESCPENFGFEVNKGGWKTGTPTGGYFSPYQNPKLEDGPPGESLPLRLGRETLQFIQDHRDEPFLAYLSFYSVHGPIQTSQERWEKYRTAAVENNQGTNKRFVFDRHLPVRQVQDCPIYGGMIEAMDDAVGLVLAGLDQLGLAENTIICFTSDNGGVSSGDNYSTSNLPLRGGKGRQWEGGIREPFYLKVPGMAEPGSTCDIPVSGIDFYPTLLELSNTPAPQEQLLDGVSLVPLLKKEVAEQIAERDLFWHYPHYGNQGGEPSSVIRHGSWKLIHYYEDGRNELYNLDSDPGEQKDLGASNPSKLNEMKSRLDTWLLDTEAKLPVPDPQYDPKQELEYLHKLQYELMPVLEKQHAQYLEPDWQPNADWWGSQLVVD